MNHPNQTLKIECPHCYRILTIEFDVIEGDTIVVRGWSDDMRKVIEHIRHALTDTQLAEANSWIDMPKCPYCQQVYRYNKRTREAKP